ncbi:monovalent cation/H(+) antiporter subunit G [Sinomonas susongensis]|uniref:monovalent cation/H(+) antiporter subunit G n=1 Tax=Sinomonas susongensis TaxID=1324851 RepID=UPI0011089DDB|nr:monovalent cation/H(+) antiporter subunit G [Sinomonas susongensis]
MSALEAVFAGLAVLVVAYASLGAVLARSPLARLHFLAPVTAIAVPLFAVAGVIYFGASLGGAAVAVVALVIAFTGPSMTTAIGRALAAEQGIAVGEPPE